jgi:hypothetical protein
VDYNSADGAVELANLNTATMAACIDACAARTGCSSAGWGNFFGANTCFMKSAIGKPNTSASWYFAIEQETEPS